MWHSTSITRANTLAIIGISVAAISAVIACADSASAANSKSKPGAPAAPVSEADQQKQAAAASRQSYESGIKSYSGGKFQPAIDQLSGALRGGGLGSPEMAKALYVRGLAYKKLSKPGLAISDLTSALWLKNGLGEADQKAAIAERAEAYRMAGLGDGSSGAETVSVADPNPAPAGAKAAAPVEIAAGPVTAPAVAVVKPATAVTAVAAPTGEVTRQAQDSEAARDAANARRLARAPVETNGLQSAAAASVLGEQPAVAAAAPVAAPVEAVVQPATPVTVAAAQPALQSLSIPAPIPSSQPTATAPVLAAAPIEGLPPPDTSGATTTVSSFFSNLFSGSSSKPAEATAPVTTASTTPAPQQATSSWSDTTSVASGSAKKMAAAKTAPQPAAAPVVPVASKGKYKLHIAAVRSRAEAEALAQRLSSQQAAALKSRMPVVDEAVIGSMGTFYRVRVGSFANAEEPRGVCNTLRSSGFDCLVVTN